VEETCGCPQIFIFFPVCGNGTLPEHIASLAAKCGHKTRNKENNKTFKGKGKRKKERPGDREREGRKE
jgi:hypothetical protein